MFVYVRRASWIFGHCHCLSDWPRIDYMPFDGYFFLSFPILRHLPKNKLATWIERERWKKKQIAICAWWNSNVFIHLSENMFLSLCIWIISNRSWNEQKLWISSWYAIHDRSECKSLLFLVFEIQQHSKPNCVGHSHHWNWLLINSEFIRTHSPVNYCILWTTTIIVANQEPNQDFLQ